MAPPDRRQFLHAVPLAAGAAGALDAPRDKSKRPKVALGLVTYNVASTWDLPTILKVCKAVGISPVELRTTHAHKVEPDLSKEQRQEVKKRFADSGVAFWGCGSTCDFHHTDADKLRKQVELCKRFVELVADLGGKGVKVRPNDLPKGVEPRKTLAQIGKALTECGKAASDAGVEIWVEVHGRGTSHPPHMKTIMQECGHPSVGVTWNSNGSDVQDGSVTEYFKLLAPWVKSCHINDLYKDQTGAYPYRELFRLLREINYDRATLIEVGRVWKDADAGAEFLRYYKALWNEQTRG
ncbi:MAG: sugar phosphate isomerase/epimerase family protein [Gemmataceae bacterium]